MLLSRLMIKNFRNFEELDIELENINVIFGINDIGKSNLLAALRFLLDPKFRREGLLDSDYYLKDISKEINIILEIKVSNEENDEDSKKIFAKSKVLKSNEDKMYIKLVANYNLEHLVSDIQMFWGGDLDELEEMRVTPQVRCDSDSIFNVIYVDSSVQLDEVFKRYTRHLFHNKKNIKTEEKEKLELCISNLNQTISDIEAMLEFQDDLSNEYKRYRKEELEIKIKSEIEMDNIYSKLVPYISQDKGKSYPTAGDGRKKLVEYSVVGLESREFEKTKINIFLIEELENHLHRSLQISLSFQLFEDCLFKHMFITTHSSLIVSRMDHVNLIKLYMKEHPIGKAHKYRVPDRYKKNKSKFNMELSEAIFADKVLLVEGPSEKILFERVLKDICPRYECIGKYILQVDGVLFKSYYEILDALGIQCIMKTDNDLKYYEEKNRIEFSGLNRCAEIYRGKRTKSVIIGSPMKKSEFDQKRKEYQRDYYKKYFNKIVLFEKSGIFLSQIDLENDLYEVIPEVMERFVKKENGKKNAIDFLQSAKKNRMVELCKLITKKDSKKIYNHIFFKCLKELIE